MPNQNVTSIHFVGIGGTAMASVAALCRQLGHTVTGSDENVYPPMSTFLEAQGIAIRSSYAPANLDHHPDLVVIGNAMKRGNPEVERILDEQFRFCSLPELVHDFLLAGHHSIVVTGTHGKTTVTSLLAWVLESAGLHPGFLIGGVPLNFPDGGARAAANTASPFLGEAGAPTSDVGATGEGPGLDPNPSYFVIEGDEYDTAFFDKRSKFVHYQPQTVILNNIEFDHADIFSDLAAVKRAFRQLVAIVPRRCLILANGDDANVKQVVDGAQSRVRFFTARDAAGYQLTLPGDHNRRNAAAVIVCATELGLSKQQIQTGLATFRGVKRRLEVRGEAAGVTVLDDFAHHPTALAATIRAIRELYPSRRVWALFEPRSNTTRRNVFQQELAAALGEADGVYIAKVDRLEELPESDRLKPELVVSTLRKHGTPAAYSQSTAELVHSLVPRLQSGDVVAVFSNGKFDGIHDKLLAALQQAK